MENGKRRGLGLCLTFKLKSISLKPDLKRKGGRGNPHCYRKEGGKNLEVWGFKKGVGILLPRETAVRG